MVADLAALLDHHDREVGPRGGGELSQADRAGEAGGAAADEEDVDLETIAFRQNEFPYSQSI